MTKSKHAQVRARQRAISPLTEYVLEYYGREYYQKGGTRLLVLDKKRRREINRQARELLDLASGGGSSPYLVETESGHQITVGHEHRKIRRI